jgi:hypothetical protein
MSCERSLVKCGSRDASLADPQSRPENLAESATWPTQPFLAAFFTLAQRFLAAAAILARASGLIVLFFLAGAVVVVAGLAFYTLAQRFF